eukprot:Pgem_evm1s12971
MCSRITCPICWKYTWMGCGKHIDQALEGVLEAERCQHKAYTQAMQNENGGN